MKSNEVRFNEFIKRATSGEELIIGFLGGSITQGSLASSDSNTYAYRVFSWLQETFSKSKFKYVNAGIGGTSSLFGGARVEDDLICHEPDFVIIDFSVNDEPDYFFEETYEGLIRHIFKASCEPVILALGNVYYDTGKTAETYHKRICTAYGIPYVSMKDSLYRQVEVGNVTRNEITPDGLHPNDWGHGILAEQIETCIEKWMNHGILSVVTGKIMQTDDLDCISPLTENSYEMTTRHWNLNTNPILEGFQKDERIRKNHLDLWTNGWIGQKVNDSITFEIEADCIAIQYRKTPKGKSWRAQCFLDDQDPILLDGNFDEDWGDCLYLQVVLHHGEKKFHRIRIELLEDADVTEAFYLNSIITN